MKAQHKEPVYPKHHKYREWMVDTSADQEENVNIILQLQKEDMKKSWGD